VAVGFGVAGVERDVVVLESWVCNQAVVVGSLVDIEEVVADKDYSVALGVLSGRV